ncbi:MAG: hypothetical protein ABI885_14315 [Gammaproteobacteria bacterium]
MSEPLEEKLRNALRPVDPGEDFTARMLARVAAEAGSDRMRPAMPVVRKPASRFIWLPAALAASLVVAVAATYEWHAREAKREQAGIEARNQVMEALRVTSNKLDLAYRIVNSPTPAPASDETGA